MVQSAAYPSVTSLGGAWFTSRLVRACGSISSRSATVMKQLRIPWNQNFRATGLADAAMEIGQLHEVARAAGGGRKHPAALQMAALGPAAIEDGCELPGDRQLQRRPVLVSSTRKTPASLSTRSQRRGITSPRRMPVYIPNQNTSLRRDW